MNERIMQKPAILFTAFLGLLALAALACSMPGVSIGANSATIDFTLTQDQVNRLFQNAVVSNSDTHGLLDKVTGVELHNGYIRVLGSTQDASGNEVSGSFDTSISAEDDILKVQVTGVNIPGVDMNDPRIVDANKKMAESLTKSVTESNGDVQFKQAEVQEGKLLMKIQVNFNKNGNG
jgi:hypothetical protein